MAYMFKRTNSSCVKGSVVLEVDGSEVNPGSDVTVCVECLAQCWILSNTQKMGYFVIIVVSYLLVQCFLWC